MLDILSTRELSILIWLTLTLVGLCFNKKLRNNFGGVLKLLFGKTIGTVIVILIAYTSVLAFLFYKLGTWDNMLIKDTVFWLFTTAAVLLFNINEAKTFEYFRNVVKRTLKWSLITQFMVNFYTFSLGIELIIVPIMITLALLLGASQASKQYVQLNKFLNNVFVVIGLFLLCLITYKTIANFQSLATIHNLFAFLLPPVFTILSIPYFYLLALWDNYEQLFLLVRFMTNDDVKRKELRRAIIHVGNASLNRLTLISQKLNKFNWYESDDVEKYIRTISRPNVDF